MKKVIVQIYEVQDPSEAEALVDLGVEHVGSIVLSPKEWKSPVIRDTVRAVQGAGATSGIIPLIGDPVIIFEILDYYRPDFVHFCEALSPFPEDESSVLAGIERCVSLQVDIRDRFPEINIMRSISVPQAGAAPMYEILTNILKYSDMLAPFSDYLLLDTFKGSGNVRKDQPVAGYVGITGEVCDWVMAAEIVKRSPIPVILAGGIDDGNVRTAIHKVKPAGVDSCTRTNMVGPDGSPIRFKKDLRKVRRLVEEVRQAEKE